MPRRTRQSDTRQEGSYPYTHTGPRPTHIATKPIQAVAVGLGTIQAPTPYAHPEPEFPSFLSLAGHGCLALNLDKMVLVDRQIYMKIGKKDDQKEEKRMKKKNQSQVNPI